MLESKTWKPAVLIKRCEESRSFLVKTENGKTFRRNRQHLIGDSNGTDDTILISDGEEEDSIEQEVIVEREELEMDPRDEVNEPQPDNLSNEVPTRSGRVSKRPIGYNNYVY